MFARFGRGWRIATSSWGVLARHPALLAFPVCAAIAFGVLFGGLFLGSAASPFGAEFVAALDQPADANPIVWVVAFAVYLVAAFIGIYFNSALVSCALDAFAGRTPTVAGGFAAANRRLPQILAWAVVAATVGFLLNLVQGMLRDKLGFLGSLLGGLLDIAWAVVTYFVVPVLVVDGVGPVEAVRRSSRILKRTWGESLAGEGGLGLISMVFVVPVFLAIPLAFLASELSGALVVVVLSCAVAYFAVVLLVFSALNAVFRAGTYLYATTGQVPAELDAKLVAHAFHAK